MWPYSTHEMRMVVAILMVVHDNGKRFARGHAGQPSQPAAHMSRERVDRILSIWHVCDMENLKKQVFSPWGGLQHSYTG
eukprot:1157194-Pelagomonas_calceolata.AAC.5